MRQAPQPKRQEFHHAHTSIGAAGHWLKTAGILAPLITGAAAGSGNWGAAFLWVAGFSLMGAVLVAGTTRWSTDQAYHAKYPADGQAAITA